jgi:hypothetical protein
MNQLWLCILQLLGVMDHPLNQYPSWYCMILFGEMVFFQFFMEIFIDNSIIMQWNHVFSWLSRLYWLYICIVEARRLKWHSLDWQLMRN